MKKLTIALLALALCFGLSGVAMAANTDNHTVTVTVNAINEIDVSGTLGLTIDSATAGSEPNGAVDNTACDLLWTTNQNSKKITVATNLASPNFTLKVVAQNVSGGTAASEVALGTTAADFVTGIAETVGSSDIQYTASATAAQGTGSDVHTVTYTLTDAS